MTRPALEMRMKMALDNAGNVNLVSSYEPGRVRIREHSYSTSLIILRDRLITDWEPDRIETLRSSHFEAIVSYRPEVLILGTGEAQAFPDPALLTSLIDSGIGVEAMANAAACRTFNVLLAEDRRAALALMFASEAD